MAATAVVIPIERQKAAQAAGRFEIDELPGRLGVAPQAVRLGRIAQADEVLRGEASAEELVRLVPGQMLATYGRAESRWVLEHARRRVGRAGFHELLSYARQLVGLDEDGRVRVCLMGHAGQGPCVPLWVVEEDVTLTVQPGDVLLRFADLTFEV